MTTMTRTMITLASGVALLGAFPLAAQEAPEKPEAPRVERAERGERIGMALTLDRSIGRLMDRRYEVGLSDDQLNRLDNLRREARTALAPIREELAAVREGVRDGSLTREQARQRMEAVRERAGSQEELHNRLEQILEPEQRQMLRQGMARRGGRRDRGFRDGPRRGTGGSERRG